MKSFASRFHLKTKILFSPANGRLLIEMIRTQFKDVHFNTFFGMLMSLVGPLLLLFVMFMIFRGRFGSAIQAYPLYILVGIVCLDFYLISTTYILRIFSNNTHLVLNSAVPRENLLITHLVLRLYKFSIELAACLGLSVLFGVAHFKFILYLFPLLAVYLLFIFGQGLILSLIYCVLRDMEHLWIILSRLLYFITPVFFALGDISEAAGFVVYYFNPLTPFVQAFRQILLSTDGFSAGNYIWSLLIGTGTALIGYAVFVKFENYAMERL